MGITPQQTMDLRRKRVLKVEGATKAWISSTKSIVTEYMTTKAAAVVFSAVPGRAGRCPNTN
jgi:hypothetical protein